MRKFLSFFILYLLCVGCVKNNSGNIYGIVAEYTTAEPLRAAGVSLFVGDNLLLKTVTYDDGHFEFNDLEAGIYNLMVEMNGYEPLTETVLVETGRTARADIQMKLAQTELEVITLAPKLAWVYNYFTQYYWEFFGAVNYPHNKDMYPLEYGFVFSKSSNPTLENCIKNIQAYDSQDDESACTISFSNTSGVDTISYPERGEDYHVRAYAINSKGVYYGADQVCHHK